MKKLCVVLVVGLCAVMFANSAFGQSCSWNYYTCSIVDGGAANTNDAANVAYGFTLTNTTAGCFTSKWFSFYSGISEEQRKIMLAIFLSAASSGKQVRVYLHPEFSYSIKGIRLLN